MTPGEFRRRDVRVGRAHPDQPGRCAAFHGARERVYSKLSRTETIIAAAAAHHRLVWIHPFLDGNGRVARLVSHARFLAALDTGAL